MPSLSLSLGGLGANAEMAGAVKIFILLTVLSVAPAIILTMTSFTRIVVVLSFLRQALGVAQSPPNQVLVGLSLFLSIFIMMPVIKTVQQDALGPFLDDKIDYTTAMERASAPLRGFMLKHVRDKDLQLMLDLAKQPQPKTPDDVSLTIVMPAFVLSELRIAFEIGFLIYLPFVLIDMVVSMVLLTMGMMVLPPIVISLPFKLMLFVLVDGWNIVVGSLVRSFQ